MKTLTLKSYNCKLDLIHNNQGCWNDHCDTCPYMRYHIYDGNTKIATVDYKGLEEMTRFINITQ